MKIKLTGTGSITATQLAASALIDERLLIDCGNGLLKHLMSHDIDIYKIDTILITHLHADHFFDLPFIILLRSFTSVENDLMIYGPLGTKKAVYKLFEVGYSDIKDVDSYLDKGRTNIIEYTNTRIVDEHYLIKTYEVDHGEFSPAYGFTVSDGVVTIGYSGDSKRCENIDMIVQSSDISILDCSFVTGNKSHMGVNDIEDLIDEYDKEIVVTHLSNESRQKALESKEDKLLVVEDMCEIVL